MLCIPRFDCKRTKLIGQNKVRSRNLESHNFKLLRQKIGCPKGFLKENIRYHVWTCRDPICLILETRFSIPGARIESLKCLKKLP